MSTPKKICIVMPTRNEAKSIQAAIEGVRAEISRLGHQIAAIVITDDSRDATREIARSLGAKVVIGGGKGLGFAMWRGLKSALAYSPDIILSMDADGQSNVQEIKSFLAPILANEADLVLGSRFKEEGLVKYHYRFKNRTGIRILVRILRYLTKLPLTDSHGGLRAMVPGVVEELEMIGTHTYVQETIIDAYEKGFRIVEIPSVWEKREAGKSRVVASIPVYVFYTLPVLILRSGQHIRFLYPVGILLILLSVLDFFVVGFQTNFSLQLMFDRQSFHLIGILMSMGVNLFFFGFILELINRMKRQVDKAGY